MGLDANLDLCDEYPCARSVVLGHATHPRVPMVRARKHLREHEQLLATGAHAEEGNL